MRFAPADAESFVRFDIDALRRVTGEKVFARGEAYHADGVVVVLSVEPERVLAQVEGTETYRTEVTGRGKNIGGTCSCPAFEDWGFCKHMVATALAANELRQDAEAVGVLARIRDHLKKRGLDALVEMIVDMAQRDPSLFKRLDIAAAPDGADDKTLGTRLRKAIDQATRTGGYVDYREAAGWVAGVDQTLDAVAGLVGGGRAAVALGLVTHAIDKIEGMIGEIDDSDGECIALLHRARDIHLAASLASRPDPIALAHDLFDREIEDEYDVCTGAATRYADVLGERGLATYRQLAAAAWARLPPRTGAGGGHEPLYDTLKNILDIFAERENDVDARIALRAKDLSSPWGYLQLAEFCRALGRDDEALRRAEEGLWTFEDGRVDERLVQCAVELLLKAGRGSDAEAHLWRAFNRAPSLNLYAALRKIGGEAAHATAIDVLEGRIRDKTQARWAHPSDLLVQILMHEQRFDAAWAAARQHGAGRHLKLTLAKVSEATNPLYVLETYGERVEELATSGGNAAYAEAAQLIGHMAALRPAPEQAAYVAALKTRFARKRNFMAQLN